MDSGMRQTIGKIDFIHSSHKMNSESIVMRVTRLSIVDWVYFKAQTLLATLKTRTQLREESYVSSEAEHFVPIISMCKKQTSVSHSSSESEIISLDAGLRMDGLLALDF